MRPADALALVRIGARWGSPVPLGETMIANHLLAQAGLPPADGRATIAVFPGARLQAGPEGLHLHAHAERVAWAADADVIVALIDGYVVRLPAVGCRIGGGPPFSPLPRHSVAADLRLPPDAAAPYPALAPDWLWLAGAVLRTLEIAGALEEVLAMTVRYANERVQFGRPIAKQQVIQHNLARLAAETAAAAAASELAADAFDRPEAWLTLAAAKSRASEAAGIGCAIAHQVHGAIGFTNEHRLHLFTRALWQWRDEFGSEATWNEDVGASAVSVGARGLWPLVTAAAPPGDVASLPYPVKSAAAEALRGEVRAFLEEELAGVPPQVRARSWNGFDAEFSRKVGQRGWIGMCWPKVYGGHERSALERYVVIEEMLAAGAPVAAHWIADRQTGPLLLKYGSEEQRRSLLPRIAAGESFACIGMSEPDAGSDLAAVRTRAEPVEGGFRVTGTKVWTTYAHCAHHMVLFCRTGGSASDRQAETSQLLIDLSTPGITINPILDLLDEHHLNEVVFDDVFVPASALVGELGAGWRQVMGELAYERSGPERFLSTITLLTETVELLRTHPGKRGLGPIGRVVSHLVVLRQMSRSIAMLLDEGADPTLEAAIVKDLGAILEQEIPEIARAVIEDDPDSPAVRAFWATLHYTIMMAPSVSLRGGTREILRGIIARGLGLR